jgi:RNA polymerase nonessential primary-like sigma factor
MRGSRKKEDLVSVTSGEGNPEFARKIESLHKAYKRATLVFTMASRLQQELDRPLSWDDVAVRANVSATDLKKMVSVGVKARTRIAMMSLPIVLWCSRFFHSERVQKADLVQVGMCGLLQAIDRWDPSISMLSTYSVYWIKKSMHKLVRQVSLPYAIPPYAYSILCRTPQAREELRQSLGRDPTLSELAYSLQTTPETIAHNTRRYNVKVVRLDSKSSTDSSVLMHEVLGKNGENNAEYMEKMDAEESLWNVLENEMDEEDYELVRKTVGRNQLLPDCPHDIARDMGVSVQDMIRRRDRTYRKIFKAYKDSTNTRIRDAFSRVFMANDMIMVE